MPGCTRKFLLFMTVISILFPAAILFAEEKSSWNHEKSIYRELLKKNMEKVRGCYAKEITENRMLSGKLIFHFEITRKGAVADLSIKSSRVMTETVKECIASTIKNIPFPKSTERTIITYPILF